MQSSRIEQEIEDIFEFIESCKLQRLSSNRVIVPKDELYDLLDELRRDVPEEIKRYQKILRQRDAILDDAEAKATAILSDAQDQYRALIEEHAIMQEAYQQAELTVNEANAQAEQIIANARAQAAEIGNGALYYTRDLLDMAEKTIASAYEATASNARALESALQGHLDLIRENKQQLVGEEESAMEEAAPAEESPVSEPQKEQMIEEASEEVTEYEYEE